MTREDGNDGQLENVAFRPFELKFFLCICNNSFFKNSLDFISLCNQLSTEQCVHSEQCTEI